MLPDIPLFKFAGLVQGLEINPKVIETTDSRGLSVGVQYKYDRHLTGTKFFSSDKTDIDVRIHSEGLVVAEQENSPNRLLTHGLRISAIDLLPERPIHDPDRDRESHIRTLQIQVRKEYYTPWQELMGDHKALTNSLARETDENKRRELEDDIARNHEKTAKLFSGAATLLKEYGTLEVSASRTWELKSPGGRIRGWATRLTDEVVKRRKVFLSFDLDADAETDQRFEDVQVVGSGQFRGKVLLPILDYPFRALRAGGGLPKNWANRDGGPYFYAGVAAVDASANDSRKTLTTEHQQFGRAQFGVSYRTEVFSTTAANAIALELSWRYYHEFDAPKALRDKHLDTTSYFKATLLFPGNYFLEYTDGKLPLDVEGASTVSVGWRHNF